MIPTSTGAAKSALHLVIPELKGKIGWIGHSRSDAKCVSLVDLTVETEKDW